MIQEFMVFHQVKKINKIKQLKKGIFTSCKKNDNVLHGVLKQKKLNMIKIKNN